MSSSETSVKKRLNSMTDIREEEVKFNDIIAGC
jgi:hypothetical protein